MRSAMAIALTVVLVLALVIPTTPEPGSAASVAAADEDDDDEEVPVKRNTDSGQNAKDETEGPRWRKPFRPNDHEDSSKRPTRTPPSLRRRLGTQELPSSEKVATPSELIRLIKQVSGNLSLSEWLQIHNLTLSDVLHGERGVLTALTATPAPHTTPLPRTTSTTTTASEAPKSSTPTIKASDILEATTINPRTRVRIPTISRTTSRPRKLPTTSAVILKKGTGSKAQSTPASTPQSPMSMDGMVGTALDPMMSPDQTDGHTSKPRRITPDHGDQHVDVESLDITTPRLTGGWRAEIRAAAERFINAQVYSPGEIPDKYSTRATSIEPEAVDTKSLSPVTEAPSVHITRKMVGQRAANDSQNELEGRKRLMPPRRLFPFARLRNTTSRAPAPSPQLPPTRIAFPLPEMIPVKTMIADAIERGALPAPSTTSQPTSATTISPVVAGDEILDLLNSEESSKRLSKILESRNMTLSELLQLRERGSSQLHFSDFRTTESTKQADDESVVPVTQVPKPLETSESRASTNTLRSHHEVPKYPFDSEEAASAGSSPAVVEAPRRSPRLLPDSAVVIPVPQEADVVAEEVDASDLADINSRFQFAGARAALAVAAGICGLAIAVFLSVFGVCRWRQRRSMRRARSAILCEQLQRGSFRGRSLSPVLVNMSKSPVPYYSTKKDLSSRATSNTASNRHYYLWRSLRKAFQEDEMQ